MNYEESEKILAEIKKAKSCVLFCHEAPDPDSILSCLLLRKILIKLGKKADVFSKDKLSKQNKTLDANNFIKIINPEKVNLAKYDILFALDVSEIRRMGFEKDINFKGKIIRLDHHEPADIADLTLFERNAGATISILYCLFKDWKIKLEKTDLDNILIGLVTDTDIFRFPYSGSKIFRRVTELIDEGGDYEKAVFFADRSNDLEVIKFWGEAIERIEIDEKYKFAYVSIPFSLFEKYSKLDIRTRQIADHYMRNINDTDFGIVMMEDENGYTNISVRSRTPGYYVLDLVKELGGGGHLTGGGASIKNMPYDEAVEKVLRVARNFAKSHN